MWIVLWRLWRLSKSKRRQCHLWWLIHRWRGKYICWLRPHGLTLRHLPWRCLWYDRRCDHIAVHSTHHAKWICRDSTHSTHVYKCTAFTAHEWIDFFGTIHGNPRFVFLVFKHKSVVVFRCHRARQTVFTFHHLVQQTIIKIGTNIRWNPCYNAFTYTI